MGRKKNYSSDSIFAKDYQIINREIKGWEKSIKGQKKVLDNLNKYTQARQTRAKVLTNTYGYMIKTAELARVTLQEIEKGSDAPSTKIENGKKALDALTSRRGKFHEVLIKSAGLDINKMSTKNQFVQLATAINKKSLEERLKIISELSILNTIPQYDTIGSRRWNQDQKFITNIAFKWQQLGVLAELEGKVQKELGISLMTLMLHRANNGLLEDKESYGKAAMSAEKARRYVEGAIEDFKLLTAQGKGEEGRKELQAIDQRAKSNEADWDLAMGKY